MDKQTFLDQVFSVFPEWKQEEYRVREMPYGWVLYHKSHVVDVWVETDKNWWSYTHETICGLSEDLQGAISDWHIAWKEVFGK